MSINPLLSALDCEVMPSLLSSSCPVTSPGSPSQINTFYLKLLSGYFITATGNESRIWVCYWSTMCGMKYLLAIGVCMRAHM